MRKLQIDIEISNKSPDFSVRVLLGNGAPQLFNNLPWAVCAKRCGASDAEIADAEVTKEMV